MYSAERAKEAGIIDDVQFRQDFVAGLKAKYGDDVVFDKKYGKKKSMDIDLSSPFGVLKFYGDLLTGPKKKPVSESSVAIVYVEGPIMPGASDPSGFPLSMGGIAYSTPIAKALDEAAADDKIKAVVLRVDSPGGSAVASEIILNATKRVAAKKPLVVSMGNVAGSGGYYVACGTKTIFADTSTITGSIGVVAGKLATGKMWEKVGINWTPIRRGANAGMLDSGDVFTNGTARVAAGLDERRSTTCSKATSWRFVATSSPSRSTSWPAAASTRANRPWTWAWSTSWAGWKTPSRSPPKKPMSRSTTSASCRSRRASSRCC